MNLAWFLDEFLMTFNEFLYDLLVTFWLLFVNFYIVFLCDFLATLGLISAVFLMAFWCLHASTSPQTCWSYLGLKSGPHAARETLRKSLFLGDKTWFYQETGEFLRGPKISPGLSWTSPESHPDLFRICPGSFQIPSRVHSWKAEQRSHFRDLGPQIKVVCLAAKKSSRLVKNEPNMTPNCLKLTQNNPEFFKIIPKLDSIFKNICGKP